MINLLVVAKIVAVNNVSFGLNLCGHLPASGCQCLSVAGAVSKCFCAIFESGMQFLLHCGKSSVRERENEIKTERQKDRKTERQKDRKTERQKDR
jgi:hypothetical protein